MATGEGKEEKRGEENRFLVVNFLNYSNRKQSKTGRNNLFYSPSVTEGRAGTQSGAE